MVKVPSSGGSGSAHNYDEDFLSGDHSTIAAKCEYFSSDQGVKVTETGW